MATFHYEAVSAAGERVRGQVDADDTLSAVQTLQTEHGYHVTALKTEEEYAALEAERRHLRAEQEDLMRKKLEAEAALERSKAEEEETAKQLKKKRRGLFKKKMTKEIVEEAPKEVQEPSRFAKWWMRFSARQDGKEAAAAKLESARAKELEAAAADAPAEPAPTPSTSILDAAIAHAQDTAPNAAPIVTPADEREADSELEDLPAQVFVQALAAAVRIEREEETKEANNLWHRLLRTFAPGYAAKKAAAKAAQIAAEAAADAAIVAQESARAARHLSAAAEESARKLHDAASDLPDGEERTQYSPTFSAVISNRRVSISERIGIAVRHTAGSRQGLRLKKRKEEQPTYGAGDTPADTETGTGARMPLRMGGTVEISEGAAPEESAGARSSIELDITKSLTGTSATGIHYEAERATEKAKEEIEKLRLNLANIEIEQPTLRMWFQRLLLKWKLARAQRKLKHEERVKAKLEAKEKKRQALLQKLRAQALKKYQKQQKLEASRAKKTSVVSKDGKTLIMADKQQTGPVPWYVKLFPSLFKHAGGAAEGGAKRMNFSMTEKEKLKEEERARLMIQGFKPTGNPFTDAFNKLNEFIIQHQGVKVKQLVTLYNLLSTMVNAGIPLVKSIHQLVDQEKNPRMKRILFQTVYEIENGKSLSKALREFPDVFNDATIGMIEAGEASGQLGSVLKRIAEESEKSHKMLSKVKGALIYPIVILVILTLVMVVVMIMVVPKMVEVFEGAGVDLPLPTRILIAMSDFIINRWYIVIGVLGVIGFSFTSYIKTEEGRYYWDFTKLKMPIFGSLFTKVSLARFTRSLSTLSSSGLSIIKALKINAESVGNQVYKQEILATAESVKKGVSIAKDLQGNKLFPAMVIDMIAVGEETAQVANVSMKVSEFYEAEVEDMVKNMQSLMEPIIIVVVGIMVGGLVAAIMLPIMNLSEVATKG